LRVISKGGLTTDVIYKFKYRVKSKIGWSEDFSPVLAARTATRPSLVVKIYVTNKIGSGPESAINTAGVLI